MDRVHGHRSGHRDGKEAVELVLAVYEGNKAVIKEKEKALENSVTESFKKM